MKDKTDKTNAGAENITKYKSAVSDGERYRGTLPHIIWLTGLSGSGKSTLGGGLEAELHRRGYNAVFLDGDNMRSGLCAGLGFSDEGRAENVRRIAEAAALTAKTGAVAVAAVISPLAEMRATARGIAEREGVPFTEVYVAADAKLCASRDPKGLYKRAYAGEIKNFTGVDAPYEIPAAPDIVVDTADCTAEEGVGLLLKTVLAVQLPLVPMLKTCVKAALDAGEKILEIYARDFEVEYKADESPLTEADKAASGIITAALSKAYPYAAVLCEETADIKGTDGLPERLKYRRCFIVDPVDGTVEFIKRNGEFTVNIALADDHTAVLGVVYVPVADTLYYAVRGMGAYKAAGASEKFVLFDENDKINVSGRTEGLIAVVSRSHPDAQTVKLYDNPENAARVAEKTAVGSSLKACRIAEGAADVHYRWGAFMKEWDTAAMQVVCEEAGALFTDVSGAPMRYNKIDVVNRNGFRVLNRPESALDTDGI